MGEERSRLWILSTVMLGLAGIGVLVVLGAWSSVAPDVLGVLLAAVVLFGAGCAWVVRVILAIRQRKVAASALVAAALVTMTAVVLAAGLPFSARWAASRPAFDAYVATLPAPVAGPTEDVACPEQLGAYRLDSCQQAYGGYLLRDRTGSPFSLTGFAYLPNGTPSGTSAPDGDVVEFSRLSGPWYTFTLTFD